MDFTNLVFGLSAQWHLVMMVTGQQIRVIKYKQRTGRLLIPAINSPTLQLTVILSAPRKCCVIAHKHIIPKDVWPYPKISERIKAWNCDEKSRTYTTSMPEKTHTFNMTGKNDPKTWYHSRVENKECHHMIILILVWVLTLQHHKGSKAELCSYYMIILRAVIMTVFTCHTGQISLYCKDWKHWQNRLCFLPQQ